MKQSVQRIFLTAILLLGIAVLAIAPAIADNGKHNADKGKQNADKGKPDNEGDHQRRPAGAVFVATNHTNLNPFDPPIPGNEVGNQIVMYHRFNDGTLALAGYFATEGQGSGPGQRFAGDGLGSSHSVQLSKDYRWLFVTNACSDTVSVFRVMRDGLELTDVEPTGPGVDPTPGSCLDTQFFPNSVTQHGDLVYVLNAAHDGSITGFRLMNDGTLEPLAGSTRGLEANQAFPPDALLNPAQVSFTPDGRQLVVTIKDGIRAGGADVDPTGPGRVLVFSVDKDGLPSADFTRNDLDVDLGIPADQMNPGPFGFSFDRRGNLLIALFVGGPNLTSAAGSFRINQDGTLTPITPVVAATDEIDLCWLENNGRHAFGANYTTGTISSYRIGHDGSLTLLDPRAGVLIDTNFPAPNNPGARSQGPTPLDLGISSDGKFLYNVAPGSGRVAGWQIRGNGTLIPLGEFPGLGQTVEGDHAPADFTPLESPAGIAVY